MIVRLTRRQHTRVLEIVADQMHERWRDDILEWGNVDVHDAASHRVDVAMPAIAWRRVWELMFDHCFDHRGMRTKGVRTTDLNAMKAMRRALNVREVHPALSGVAAIGMIGELIPAWKQPDDGGPRYYPYPIQWMDFVVLAPESRTVQRQSVTQWVESTKLPDRRILHEIEHLKFA